METMRHVLARSVRGMTTVLALAGAMLIATSSPAATLPFVEPSFENGGSPTMSADYVASGADNNAVSTLAADKWHMRTKDHGQEGFILEDKDSYKGYTSVPTGVSGEQFITGSRGNNYRGLFQYIQDNKATTGKITATMDNWVHELNAGDPVAGTGDVSFEVIAFDDPATVNVDLGGAVDIVTGSGFVSTGDSYQTRPVVDAATGFGTLQATLDLGAGYNYIGVAVATSKSGLNPYNNASGNTASFDNLQVETAGSGGNPVVYEGFNYPAGDVDGSQAGGTGFAAAGWTTTGFTRNPYDVRSDGLSFPGMPMLGGSVRRPSAPDNAEMHREISAAAQAALTADNSTIWFSVLTRDDEYAGRYGNAALVLGTDAFDDPGDKPITMTGGSALGVAINGQGDNSFRLHAIAIKDGSTSLSTDFMPMPGAEGTTYLLAGKIEWAPDGSDDTLTLYNILDPTSDTLPAPFATITADLGQSAFDTIAIGDQQITPFDEIRFATTFAEAMAREAAVEGDIPEPATMALCALAACGLGGYVRRRRKA